jgi:hypothetical protein
LKIARINSDKSEAKDEMTFTTDQYPLYQYSKLLKLRKS